MNTAQKNANAHLIVGRDRAHVRTLLAQYPRCQGISASAFFDRVRMLSFLQQTSLRRDDFAPLLVAKEILLQEKSFPVRWAGRFASLYSSFFHGTAQPSEVAQHCGSSSEEIQRVVQILARMEHVLESYAVVNGVQALFNAWKIIETQRVLPFGLSGLASVTLCHLIDLTLLEIEVIKSLSRLGLPFLIHFPLDFQSRGINVAVDFAARQFERDDSLVNTELQFESLSRGQSLAPLLDALLSSEKTVTLTHNRCSIAAVPDLAQEADAVAQKIACLLSTNPHDSVVVGVRTIDARARVFRDALDRFGISVKDRKGRPLNESAAGILFDSILTARRFALRKKDFTGLLLHPSSSLNLPCETKRADCIWMLKQLGIDNRISTSLTIDLRYRDQLARFKQILSPDDPVHEICTEFEKHLIEITTCLEKIPLSGTFFQLLDSVCQVIADYFCNEDHSVVRLQETLSAIKNSLVLKKLHQIIDLGEFTQIISAELAKQTVAPADQEQGVSVEFLTLPEIFGRSFDHVFIPDITLGRLPQNQSQDPLLDDMARIHINSLMKKSVLRVFFDDPFEPLPVPPRQALEPFWFASSVAAAHKSVHFSYAIHDHDGQEQSPSEFFVWLREHVSIKDPEIIHEDASFCSVPYQRFLTALEDRDSGQLVPNDSASAYQQRRQSFLSHQTDTFAFHTHSDVLSAISPNTESSDLVLTPTVIESFAQCRFKGFLRHIAKIESQSDHDDVDARAIGQIAHRSLEKFYAQKRVELHNIREIINAVARDYLCKNFVKNQLVLSCHIYWLHDALSQLVENISRAVGVSSHRIIAVEKAFGLADGKKYSLTLRANDRSWRLGGRVDRIDKLGDSHVVIDYKLTSLSNLKVQTGTQQLLHSHFQMPVYLRLVENFVGTAQHAPVSFAFASIRDAALTPIITPRPADDLYKKIFIDETEGSLAQRIDEIFSPLRHGIIDASPGEHCDSCQFNFICRVSEGE